MGPRFSLRTGAQPVRPFQTGDMAGALRTRIWNTLHKFYHEPGYRSGAYLWSAPVADKVLRSFWSDFLKLDMSAVPKAVLHGAMVKAVKERFDQMPWYRVYDAVEWHIEQGFVYAAQRERLVAEINDVLTEERSGYTVLGELVVPTITEDEIKSVEAAASSHHSLVNLHITEAISKLSEKPTPDVRNSIKESISAVETLCKLIAGTESATLNTALATLQSTAPIHPAFKGALEKLYGYTSASDGIRHSLMAESNLKVEDGVFMLVTCSAFVNYLSAKAHAAGIFSPTSQPVS